MLRIFGVLELRAHSWAESKSSYYVIKVGRWEEGGRKKSIRECRLY